MVDTELDHSVPTANAWLSIVTTVVKWSRQRLINLLLHSFADCIYNQHAKASGMNDTDHEEIPEKYGDENSIVALIRMCCNQLRRSYENNTKHSNYS